MKNLFLSLIFLQIAAISFGQFNMQKFESNDITHFWEAYDKIISTTDTALQIKYLDDIYINNATDGLKSFIQLRNYKPKEYIDAIKKYPKFWASLRKNSLNTKMLYPEIELNISQLRVIYPDLKPATIYFLIGVFRSPGTGFDSRVLIGSEYSLGDNETITEEFDINRQNYYKDFKPKENLGLTCTHEYIHTQQKEMADDLLYVCLYEGIAEYISCLATKKTSNSPSISFGKANHQKVVAKFLEDIHFGNFNNWLWSENSNELKVRDLGYYIGYEISERYYKISKNKKKAIKELIELDYNNNKEVERIIDATKIFPKTLKQMLDAYNKKRPTVVNITPFKKNKEKIKSGLLQYSITFSEEMDINFRGFGYGPLGENYIYEFNKIIGWSNNNKTFTIEVKVKPNKKYQVLINNNFRNKKGFRLMPFLIEFETKE